VLQNSLSTLPICMVATAVKVRGKYRTGLEFLDAVRIIIHGRLLITSENINFLSYIASPLIKL
jgi:hypothetical protein